MNDDQEQDFIAAPSPADSVVGKPPRARVEDAVDPDETPRETMERKRDYLEGFLAKKPEEDSVAGPGGKLQQAVIDALKEIYDPEIPVNIYDLGLIYGVEVDDESDVTVTMTLTTPHCPVAEILPAQVKSRVELVDGVDEVDLELTWDPPWSPENMSEEAKLELGFM